MAISHSKAAEFCWQRLVRLRRRRERVWPRCSHSASMPSSRPEYGNTSRACHSKAQCFSVSALLDGARILRRMPLSSAVFRTLAVPLRGTASGLLRQSLGYVYPLCHIPSKPVHAADDGRIYLHHCTAYTTTRCHLLCTASNLLDSCHGRDHLLLAQQSDMTVCNATIYHACAARQTQDISSLRG